MLWMRKKGDRRKNRRLEEGIWPMGQIPSSNPFLFTINGILLNWNTGILFNWNKQSTMAATSDALDLNKFNFMNNTGEISNRQRDRTFSDPGILQKRVGAFPNPALTKYYMAESNP